MNMHKATLFIVAAPSGGGKTSLVNALIASTNNLLESVSHTTRPARTGEVDGQDYHFVSAEAFNTLREEGTFLEHAEVFTHQYGTSRTWVEEKLHAGIDVILEVDWQGARQIKALYADAIGIFILPPSLEILEKRLRARGQDAKDVIERRLQEAQTEMSHYNEFDYLIINDEFDEALIELQAVVCSEGLKREKQQLLHLKLLHELLG